MTSMSISQDSGALDSDRVETEEGEEESASTSTGKCHKKHQSIPKVNICGELLLFYSKDHGRIHILFQYAKKNGF